MDIERLKELRKVVEEKSCRIVIEDDGAEFVYEINDKELMWALEECAALIDETIARQSATSEEVAEAISHIQGGYGDIWQWPKKRRNAILAALQEYQPWIPVSDRLPTEEDADVDGYVLITREDKRIDFCKWNYVLKGDFAGRKYTHWKPLPEPPKGE